MDSRVSRRLSVVGGRSPSGADDIVSSAVFRSHKTGASTLAPYKNTRLKKIILNEGDVAAAQTELDLVANRFVDFLSLSGAEPPAR